MQHQNLKRQTEDFKREFLDDPKSGFSNKFQTTLSGASSNQQQGGSGNTYAITDQSHPQQRTQRDYYTDQQRSYLAGGDANVQALRAKYSTDGKELRSKRSQTRQTRTRNPNATYSESSPSSSRSDSTRRTAIEQNKKGRQLMKLTHSKASLLKTVDEGMNRVQPDHCCCNKMCDKMTTGQCRHPPKEMFHSGSEESNTCSSPSAGLINEKIIHPMIKKFRLLYLHNIKEEVSIMEDLEMLPHKLDEICRKMEKE